jgi:hypothetical protein
MKQLASAMTALYIGRIIKPFTTYTILEDEIEGEYFYTQDEIKMFYDRRQKHLNGESKSYTVAETLNLVRQNRQSNGL